MICKNNSIFNVISPEKGFCFHTLLTFQLYLCKNQHSFSTCCMDPLFICQEDCSRNSICFLSADFTFPHFQSFSIKKCISTWPWIQAAYKAFQFFCRFSEIHQSHLFGDHSRIRCRTLLRLFFKLRSSLLNRWKRLDQQIRTGLRKFSKQASTCFCRRDRYQDLLPSAGSLHLILFPRRSQPAG